MTHNNPPLLAAKNRIEWSLLALRISVFIVMFVWSIDKFINPAHSSKIFDVFYGIGDVPHVAVYILGAMELFIVLAFLGGVQKRYTYGVIFLIHGASTLSSFPQYSDPFKNLLFFAAWPMWGACFALFMLRELDNKFTLTSK